MASVNMVDMRRANNNDDDDMSDYGDLRKEFQSILNRLGINKEAELKFWTVYSDDDGYHDLPSNVIREILEVNYDSVEGDGKSEEDLLQSAGFLKSSPIFEFLSKQTDEHLSLFNKVDDFLELFFTPDRPNSCAEFPFQDGCRNEAFNIGPYVPIGSANYQAGRQISCKNVDQVSSLLQALQEEEEEAQKRSKGFVSAYHGTSAVYTKSIVEQNIRIEAGRRRQDFSDLGGGFYAGSSLRSAVKFAKKRLDRLESPGLKRKADFPETGAVLVFRIPIETLDSMKVVDMLNTDFSCDLEAWTNIVQFYRRGEMQADNPRPVSLPDEPHYLRGPVAAQLCPVTPHPTLTQICVRSKPMAKLMDACLEKIIFFKKNVVTYRVRNEANSKTSLSCPDVYNCETLLNVLVD